MIKAEYTKIILARPPCLAWAAEADQKGIAVDSGIDIAVDRISLASEEFDFAQGEETQVCEAGVSEYTIQGEDKNVRSVVDITIGDNRTLLDKYTKAEAHRYINGTYLNLYPVTGSSTLQVGKWYVEGSVQGHPRIKLMGSPGTETLYMWCLLRGIPVAQIPDEWAHVVMAVCEAELFGSGGVYAGSADKRFQTVDPRLFDNRANKRLSHMIDEYSTRAGQSQPYPADDITKKHNRRHSGLSGY